MWLLPRKLKSTKYRKVRKAATARQGELVILRVPRVETRLKPWAEPCRHLRGINHPECLSPNVQSAGAFSLCSSHHRRAFSNFHRSPGMYGTLTARRGKPSAGGTGSGRVRLRPNRGFPRVLAQQCHPPNSLPSFVLSRWPRVS
jgi:hypothetical protein